jgi:hypothetical protein
VDLADPTDIPQLDGKPCWEYSSDINLYPLENFLFFYIGIPYHIGKKKFLWTRDTIPVSSNGKIKDWENEAVGPKYADDNGVDPAELYYTAEELD